MRRTQTASLWLAKSGLAAILSMENMMRRRKSYLRKCTDEWEARLYEAGEK